MEEEDPRVRKAQKRVKKIKGFYHNLITYAWVNLLLLAINLLTNPHNLWFYWVSIIWGVVLAIQAINIFSIKEEFLGEEWEKKKLDEILKKEKKDE